MKAKALLFAAIYALTVNAALPVARVPLERLGAEHLPCGMVVKPFCKISNATRQGYELDRRPYLMPLMILGE